MSNYPIGEEDNYIEQLKNIYVQYKKSTIENLKKSKNFRKSDLKRLNGLFEPKTYHVFSQFDVSMISLVNNFKFPQRVFEPNSEENHKIKTVSYQVLSGSIIKNLRNNVSPQRVINRANSFIKIVQLKINNGLLIGNGSLIISEALKQIEEIFKNRKISNYILVDSFNWAELILVISHKSPETIANAVLEIRRLAVFSLPSDIQKSVIENSLFRKWKCKNIEMSHLFIESHSFLAVSYGDFLNIPSNVPFHSSIEWKIKPGHFGIFEKEITALTNGETFDTSKTFFKTGKTDYLIPLKHENTLRTNQEVFKILRAERKQLSAHIRKIKTDPLFYIDSINQIFNGEEAKQQAFPPSNEKELFRYRNSKSLEVSGYLKKLNISRNIRKKIHKIIYNYNLGIQDSILFLYFIDLKPLLDNFIEILKFFSDQIVASVTTGKITEQQKKDQYGIFNTKYIEDVLQPYIDVFEEAIQDRILNNYNYEEINEFTLDTNSSLSGILSSLDPLIKFYGQYFRTFNGNTIITTINDKETLSNKINVNYNVEHITNPPLIFATLIKEILNTNIYNTGIEREDLLFRITQELRDKDLSEYEKDCMKHNFIAYFAADYKKYKLTFFDDMSLFTFWHWSYALQNTHLYTSIGCFSEVSFVKELFRLVLIVMSTDKSNLNNVDCPIPELRSYWDKHFNRIVALTKNIVDCTSFQELTKSLHMEIEKSLLAFSTKLEKSENGYSYNRFVFQIIISNLQKDVDQFVSFFYTELTSSSRKKKISGKRPGKKEMYPYLSDLIKNARNNKNDESATNPHIAFLLLSTLTVYSLNYIYKKFEGEVKLLRRDFATGEPIHHFLETNYSWHIDPAGGFFINSVEEIEDYVSFSNKIISLMRHLGNVLKKDAF